MATLLLDLNNEQNWQLAYNETAVAGRVGGSTLEYYPLLPFELPILLQSPILLISAENIDAKPWWFLGLRIQQRVSTSLSFGEVSGSNRKIPVNRPSLIQFPPYAPQYSLRVEIPPWFDKMKIAVWEYTGLIDDSTESLVQERTDVIRVDLTRIETKIDAL